MKRRHPFILAEIALGLVLIVLALGPILGSMSQQLRKQHTLVQTLRTEWENTWRATEWLEQIAAGKLPLPTETPTTLAPHTTLTRTGHKEGASLFEIQIGSSKYRFYRIENK